MCGGAYIQSDHNRWMDEQIDRERRRREAVEEARRQAILHKAMSVSKKAENYAKSSTEPDVAEFSHSLGVYLHKRSQWTFWGIHNYDAIESRAAIIDNCIDSLIKMDKNKISNCLEEEAIKPLKGYFRKRMYTIMKTFQNYPARRREEVAKTAPLPLDMIKLVDEYEALFYNPEQENTQEEKGLGLG